MVSTKASAVARLTLRFQLKPSKYVQMSFTNVNPASDLSNVGRQIAAVTDYRDYPMKMTTDIG